MMMWQTEDMKTFDVNIPDWQIHLVRIVEGT